MHINLCVDFFFVIHNAHYKDIVKHETPLRASRSNNSQAANASLFTSSQLKEKFLCALIFIWPIGCRFFLLLFLLIHHSAEFIVSVVAFGFHG